MVTDLGRPPRGAAARVGQAVLGGGYRILVRSDLDIMCEEHVAIIADNLHLRGEAAEKDGLGAAEPGSRGPNPSRGLPGTNGADKPVPCIERFMPQLVAEWTVDTHNIHSSC